MPPYTVRVGRSEIRLYSQYDAVKRMLRETRKQARYEHPRSVALYHYGELVAEW